MAIILDANRFFSETYQGYLETHLFLAIAKALPQQQFMIPAKRPVSKQIGKNIQSLPFPAAKGLFQKAKLNKWLKEQNGTTFISFNRTLKTNFPIRQILIIGDEQSITNNKAIEAANVVGIVFERPSAAVF